MAKFLISTILIFYLLSLLQASFLVHLNMSGIIFNFILISVILINLFQKPENSTGILAAIIGGFFLDVFSGWPIGFWILTLFLISIFIKKIFKNYVRIPFTARA